MENILLNLVLVLIGILITEIYHYKKDIDHKSRCISDVHELIGSEVQQNIQLLLPQSGNLLSTTNWETCNSDGSFGFLPTEEKVRINDIYNKINNYNYEAKLVAQWRDKYNCASGNDKTRINIMWGQFSQRLINMAKDLQIDLENLLNGTISSYKEKKIRQIEGLAKAIAL